MAKRDPEQPLFPTIPAAAKRSGIGPKRLRAARDAGELRVYRVGGWDRVHWPEVVEWIRKQRVPVRDAPRARRLEKEKRAT